MDNQSTRKGILYGAVAYMMWGFLPLYWKLVQNVSADEILAHRFVWSFVFMLIVLGLGKRWKEFGREVKILLQHPKSLMMLIIVALLISINWFLYIWAVNHGHIIETSLGYYMNPLVSILLGLIVMKEKLNFWQFVSVGLATIGVLFLTVQLESFPWIAITLALSFGIYGLAKKMTNYEATVGLTMETMVITPLALMYLIYLAFSGNMSFGTGDISLTLLLMGGGAMTALPLLYFAKGAKLIPLTTLGFLQYVAPTISLCIGVFLYNEQFTKAHAIAFSFIWTAIIIFSFAKTKVMTKLQPKFKS